MHDSYNESVSAKTTTGLITNFTNIQVNSLWTAHCMFLISPYVYCWTQMRRSHKLWYLTFNWTTYTSIFSILSYTTLLYLFTFLNRWMHTLAAIIILRWHIPIVLSITYIFSIPSYIVKLCMMVYWIYRRTPTYVAPTYVDPDLHKKLLVPLPPLLPLQPPPHPPLPLPQLNTTVTPVSIINYYVFY